MEGPNYQRVADGAPALPLLEYPSPGGLSVSHDVQIRRPDGSVVFEKTGVFAPAHWSERAVRIAAQKYLIKRGLEGGQGETSCAAMLHGVATAIARSGFQQGYFPSLTAAEEFRDAVYARQWYQHGAFNSPVYFNVRHWEIYKISGGGGNYAWDFDYEAAHKIAANYQRPQASACFILGVRDSLCGEAGVSETLAAEARIFKYGSGAGANFSALREKGAALNVGGTSSGVLSFLRVLDAQAGAIKSAGTTRRAAKMVILDDDHPDLPEFIQWKVKEEAKAQVLVAAGYSADLDGEAYQSVSGQNANNSVRVTDAFMQAVEADQPWSLRSRLGGEVTQTLPARQLYREMMEAAWSCGDPGLQYDDSINRWHTTPKAGRIRGSNPCSEYLHLDDSACNLASLRLTQFLAPDGRFLVEDFREAVRTFLFAQEILVDYASYPTSAICEGAHHYRQLGLGYCDLSAMLMQMGLGYDTDAGRTVAACVTSLMTAFAYEMSADIAARVGPFPTYDEHKEDVLRVLAQHKEASPPVEKGGPFEYLQAAARSAWLIACSKANLCGVRNAQVTLLAPTGTISFLMDATTTGVEPLLALVQEKTLVGGGVEVLENTSLRPALTRLGFHPAAQEDIVAWVRQHGTLRGAPGFNETDLPVFATALGSEALPPEAHVRMLGAVQPFLSGGISKTVNLPASATVEDFERMGLLAWKEGVKCLALYRDGSKGVQPVRAVTSEARAIPTRDERPEALAAPAGAPRGVQHKLPSVRRGITWAVTLDGHKLYIRSGEYPDGTLGEVFVDIAQDGSTLGGMMCTWARSLSIGLQYGVPLEEYVKSHLFTRYEPSGPVRKHPTIRFSSSLTDLVIRVLAVYYLKRTDLQHVEGASGPVRLEDGAVIVSPPAAVPPSEEPLGQGPPCPTCGTLTVRNAVCFRCPNCGESLGCS